MESKETPVQTQPYPEDIQATEESKPVIEKKKGGMKWLWFCGCGCLIILALCIGTGIGVYLLAPNAVNQVLRNTSVLPQDSNLTRVDSSTSNAEIRAEANKVQAKIEAAQSDLDSKPAGSKVELNLTSEELIYALFANSEETGDAEMTELIKYISIGMVPNLLTAQVDVGGLVGALRAQNNNTLDNSPVDLSLLEGTQARVELTTTPDNKQILVKSVTTGNPIIDSFINVQSALDSANEEISGSFDGSFEGAKVDTVQIQQDNLKLVFTK